MVFSAIWRFAAAYLYLTEQKYWSHIHWLY